MRRAYVTAHGTMLLAIVLAGVAATVAGCGTIDMDGFLAENACNVFNCETLSFVDDIFASRNDDHDEDGDEDVDDGDATEGDHDESGEDDAAVDGDQEGAAEAEG